MSTDRFLGMMLGVSIMGVLIVLLTLARFSFPAADDFCYASQVRHQGIVDSQRHWYRNWSGRVSATAAISVFSVSLDLVRGYPLGPLVILLGTFAGFRSLVHSLAGRTLSAGQIVLAGGMLSVLFIAGTPDPAQTFYWMSGSFTYQLANIYTLFLFSALARESLDLKRGARPKIHRWLLAAALSALAVCSNEVSLVAINAVLFGLFAVIVRDDSGLWRPWLLVLLTSMAAGLFSILAPGNWARADGLLSFPMPRLSPLMSALAVVPWGVLRCAFWLSNVGLWASAFVVLVCSWRRARAALFEQRCFRRVFLLFPVSWGALICLLNLLGFYVNGYPLPERAESVVYLLFLLGWYPSFVIICHFLVGPKNIGPMGSGMRIAGVLLVVSIIASPNIFESYKDLYRGYRFYNEMNARFENIAQMQRDGMDEVVLTSLSRPPRTMFATDISTDPGNHRNRCMAKFFGFETVRLGDR